MSSPALGINCSLIIPSGGARTRSMASWYFVGIPLAALFVLKWDWALRGQWIGMAIGNTVSVASVAVYCNGLDMQKVSDEAVAKAKKKAKGTG